jgi:hypothetical protein
MRYGLVGLIGVAALALPHDARAWSHTGYYGHASASGGGGSWSADTNRGGTASGGGGSWNAKGAEGGNASGGDGSWSAHSAYGGNASGGEGSWHATGAEGTQASGGYHEPTQVNGAYPHAYGGTYYSGYHPPTTVDYYGNSCGNCGGWTGGAAAAAGAMGLAAGAAVGASETAANEAASNSAAYSAGVATGEGIATPPGGIYTKLPPNCAYQAVGTKNYFNCGNMWLTAAYGANGLYYKVVPAP